MVWVVRRGGGIGDVRLAVESVALVAVQVVRLRTEEALVRPVRFTFWYAHAEPESPSGQTRGPCVARKPD